MPEDGWSVPFANHLSPSPFPSPLIFPFFSITLFIHLSTSFHRDHFLIINLFSEMNHLDADLKSLVQNNVFKFILAGDAMKEINQSLFTLEEKFEVLLPPL